MSSTTKHAVDSAERRDLEILDPRNIQQIVERRKRAEEELREADRQLGEALEAHRRVTRTSGLFPTQRNTDAATTVMPTVQRTTATF